MLECFPNLTWSPGFGNLASTPQNDTKLLFVFQMPLTMDSPSFWPQNCPFYFPKGHDYHLSTNSPPYPCLHWWFASFFQVLMMSITSYSNSCFRLFKHMESWSLTRKVWLQPLLLTFLAWKSKKDIISLDPILHKSYSTFPKVTLPKRKSNNSLELSIISKISCHMSITIQASCLHS